MCLDPETSNLTDAVPKISAHMLPTCEKDNEHP